MPWLKRVIPVAAVSGALVAAACSESTAPSAVDATAIATAVTGLNSSLSQNAVLQSLVALNGSRALAAAVARAAMPPLPGAGRTWATSAEQAREALSQLASRAPLAPLALFPANVLGKTFQWDTTSPAAYRITDSSLAGAPANGVRFRLYQVDTATLKPSLPLTATGYVDLTDASTPQANVLQLLLRVGTQTAANYTITEVKTTSSLTLTAVGYVTNVVTGGAPVNFNLTHVLSLADSSLSTNYQASGSGVTISLVTTVSAAGGVHSLTMDWIVSKGGSVEIVGTSTDAAINVQFKFNGTTVATVTGTPANPSITTASGQQLTVAQLLALATILQEFEEVYLNLSLLFVPGLLVFG
jgi:hypothetical protein